MLGHKLCAHQIRLFSLRADTEKRKEKNMSNSVREGETL